MSVNYFILFYMIFAHIISSPECKCIQAIALGTPYRALHKFLPLRPEVAHIAAPWSVRQCAAVQQCGSVRLSASVHLFK
jgi:hypothetical protein